MPMADEHQVSITNTGNGKIRIILNYREAGCATFDLMPPSEMNASLKEVACVVINDVDNLAVFGQNVLGLWPVSR